MTDLFFNFHNIITVGLTGSLPLRSREFFKAELGYFESVPPRADIQIEFVSRIEKPDTTFFPNYGRDATYFYLKDPYSNTVGIASGAKVIVEANVDPGWLLKDIIEPLLLLHMLVQGYVFLHASAVAKDSKGYLFAASPQTGKTNILLSLLQSGFSFLSDEMALLSKSGTIYPYPRPISLYPYNIKAYPELMEVIARKSWLQKQKIRLISFFQRFQNVSFVHSPRSLFFRAVKMGYTRVFFRHFSLQPADMKVGIGEKCAIEAVFLLERSETASEPALKEVQDKRLFAVRLWANIMGEKSHFFAETIFAYSFVFPEKKALLGDKNLCLGEEVIYEATRDKKCFVLTIPKHADFQEVLRACQPYLK